MRFFWVRMLLVAWLIIGLSVRTTSAQTGAEDYLPIVREALSEFDAGDYEEALALFQRAYSLHPSARVLRGLARTRFELRQYVECMDAADLALSSPLDPLSSEMQTEVSALRDRAAQFVGTIVVQVEPPTATVLLDGREVAASQLGMPIRIAMGSHTVEATAASFLAQHRTVDVVAGARADAHLVLEAVPMARADSQPPPRYEAQAGTEDSQSADPSLLVAGIVVGAAGAIAFAVGLGAYFDRQSTLDSCTVPPFGTVCFNAGTLSGERDAMLAPTIIGAAALVAGISLIIAYAAGQNDPAPRASAMCLPTSDGVMCAGGVRW